MSSSSRLPLAVPAVPAVPAAPQEQIRRQLAKMYKGQPDGPGGACLLEDLEVYDELGRGGYGTVYRAVRISV